MHGKFASRTSRRYDMYDITMNFECGSYSTMSKTTLGVPAEINRILNLARKEYCDHELLSCSVSLTTKKFNSSIKYSGSCTFGA